MLMLVFCQMAFIFTCATYVLPVYDGYVYPAEANALGFFISVLPLLPIPFFMVKELMAHEGSLLEVNSTFLVSFADRSIYLQVLFILSLNYLLSPFFSFLYLLCFFVSLNWKKAFTLAKIRHWCTCLLSAVEEIPAARCQLGACPEGVPPLVCPATAHKAHKVYFSFSAN